MAKRKLQFGRSINEMLMTLAIIGIISVGSVVGFRMAMTRHQVNNLIEDAKLAGFVVVDGLFQSVLDAEDGYILLAGKFAQTTPYTFKALAVESSTKIFDILAENVPYKVCIEVIKRKMDWVEEIRANGTENACHENDNNEIDFFFNAELREKPELPKNTCRSSRDCPSNKPYCRSGYCTKCEDGMLELNGGTCVECPESYVNNTKKEYCYTCGKDHYFGYGCYNCSSIYSKAKKVSREECARCSNRCWDEEQHLCLLTTVDDPFNNNGVCNYACTNGTFATHSVSNGIDACMPCPPINGFYFQRTTTEAACHSCGQQYVYSPEKWCLGCFSANNSYASNVSKTECKRCTNRYFDEETSKCLLCNGTVTNGGLGCE